MNHSSDVFICSKLCLLRIYASQSQSYKQTSKRKNDTWVTILSDFNTYDCLL